MPFAVDDGAGRRRRLPAARVIASRSGTRQLLSDGPVKLVAVRFRTGALRHLSLAPFADLEDRFAPADEVFGGDGARLLAQAIAAPGERVDQAASALGTSRRQLERTVSAAFGRGPKHLLARSDHGGVLACGVVDPAALTGLGIPAARVRATRGPSVADASDLLAGEVRETNPPARALGVEPGMSGRDALARL